ncbi:glycosyltransferase family 4 protein [Sphingomonas sp. KR1UV-12]|uniref:Glycosyltransferase family 4 protein n=1 Tax=Sphingomonas aurea TaxID=3063994 RepID=A0ABT9EJW7_9SPHN|nr:glycosyltransferase family 4 protein [Sphingomonas sp. KR1UV-12]MDP1027140.1 glycosyltransferase family 4 protein [Sphingomonas sp. KR1UV-12]
MSADELGGSAGQPRRILLVAPNISRRMGGEGLKAMQIHLELRAMGHDVRQVTHARVYDEMRRDHPELAIDYLADGPVQVALNRLRLSPLLAVLNAWQLHRLATKVAAEFDPWVVHFTSPISPVLPYFRMRGSAVVIGPLNGNVAHPPAFRDREPRGKIIGQRILAPLQAVLGRLFRGKRDAVLLVAGGDRTVRALELGGCTREQMVPTLDCGIPDALIDRPRIMHTGINHRFVHLGRLVGYKACDLAIRAVAAADPETTLDVIGDGEERAGLEALVAQLGLGHRVRFVGWLPAGSALYDRLANYRGLVLPALAEANGIAFQEAMALGLPVVCVNWAGPQMLLSSNEAIMIAPAGVDAVIDDLATAMNRLACDGEAADAMAASAHARAIAMGFRWRDLLNRWQHAYHSAAARSAS